METGSRDELTFLRNIDRIADALEAIATELKESNGRREDAWEDGSQEDAEDNG